MLKLALDEADPALSKDEVNVLAEVVNAAPTRHVATPAEAALAAANEAAAAAARVAAARGTTPNA